MNTKDYMRDYDKQTLTLSEFIALWRNADVRTRYCLVRDYPGLATWLERDPLEFLDKTFGHLHANPLNKRVRDWSGVEAEKPRGKPTTGNKKKVLPVAPAGQQDESRQQDADIPPADGAPALDNAGGETPDLLQNPDALIPPGEPVKEEETLGEVLDNLNKEAGHEAQG